MVKTASSRLDRSARCRATRVWIPASIMWRKMKSLSSYRPRRTVVKLQEVAKQAKPWGLRSCRKMPWSLMRFEIVATILSWLPVKPILRFRCVCKEWRSMTYNPNFIKEHHACARALGRLALISRRYLSPKILLYDFGDTGEVRNQVFDLGFGELHGLCISNPVNGLVGIQYRSSYMADDGSHYILNPATRERAKLPASGNGPWGKGTSLGLGFDSSTGGYKLVKLFHAGRLDSCGCKVLELGTQEWREVGIAPCKRPANGPVLLNGALHWISWRCLTGNINVRKRTIVAFNLKDENFRSIQVPSECRSRGRLMYVVEWEGLLCMVKLPSMDIPESVRPLVTGWSSLVRIWRMEDYATCRWREAHCSELPNHACVDGRLSLVGIRGHELLIVTSRSGGSGSVCSYDLRTRSLRELYNGEDPNGLQYLTESLVSPGYLAGNLSPH